MLKSRARTIFVVNLGIAGSCLGLSMVSFADHPTLGLQQDGAGAITTLTAITLDDGASAIGVESQYLSNDEIDDSDLAEFAEEGELVHSVESVHNFTLNAAYGLTENLTIGLNFPYVTRNGIREGAHHSDDEAAHSDHEEQGTVTQLPDADHEPGEGAAVSHLGDASGIGDLTVYSQYRFLGTSGSRVHASALLGLKTPTGATDLTNDQGHRFDAEHQPGSGSWDLMTGLAFTRQWSRTSIDSNVLYAFAGDGSQDSNLGDVFNYNIALSHRLQHSDNHGDGSGYHYHSDSQNSWDLAVELNGEWRDHVAVAGARQTHTGGNVVYVAPSLRFNSNKGWAAYVSVGVPVVTDLNGSQSEPRYRFFVGISTSLGDTW